MNSKYVLPEDYKKKAMYLELEHCLYGKIAEFKKIGECIDFLKNNTDVPSYIIDLQTEVIYSLSKTGRKYVINEYTVYAIGTRRKELKKQYKNYRKSVEFLEFQPYNEVLDKYKIDLSVVRKKDIIKSRKSELHNEISLECDFSKMKKLFNGEYFNNFEVLQLKPDKFGKQVHKINLDI